MTIFRSKRLVLTLTLAFFALSSVAAMAQEQVSAERAALAKAYVDTMPIEQDVKTAIDALANRVAPEDRVLFRRLGESAFDYARLRLAAEAAVLEVFTDNEIKALTAFYSTPEGKSVRTKTRTYDQRMQPVMNAVMADFVKKLQENNIVPKQ